jgi:hypothetical protein
MVERTKFVHIKPTETTQILASYSELRPSVVPNPAWWLCNVEFSYQNSSQGLPVTCVFFELHVSFSSEWIWLLSQDLMTSVQTQFSNHYKHLPTAPILTLHGKCKQIILELAPNRSLHSRTERGWSWRCNSSTNNTHIPSIIFLPPYPWSTEDFSLQICRAQQDHRSSIHATDHPIRSLPQITLS